METPCGRFSPDFPRCCVSDFSIETLRRRLSWLEQLCRPGPQVVLDGIAQPYPGPAPELLQERDQLRRGVRIAELDYMIEGAMRYAPGAEHVHHGGTGPAATQIRQWTRERDKLAQS